MFTTVINDPGDGRPTVSRIAHFPKVMMAEAEQAMYIIVADFESETVERAPTGATGDHKSSIIGEVLPLAGEEITGRVGSPLHTMVVVEEGAGPAVGRPKFMPPPGVLVNWIRKVLGVTGDEEVEKAENAIRWKIWQKGIKGHHMFRDAWNQAVWSRATRLWQQLLKTSEKKYGKK